jgi:hypothetical protein
MRTWLTSRVFKLVLTFLVVAGVLGLAVYLVVTRPESDFGVRLLAGTIAALLIAAIRSTRSWYRARRQQGSQPLRVTRRGG